MKFVYFQTILERHLVGLKWKQKDTIFKDDLSDFKGKKNY